MKYKRITFYLAVIALLAGAPRATACSWSWIMEPGTPLLADGSPVPDPESLSTQQFLFVGTVISRTSIPSGDAESDRMFALGSSTTFQIQESWRGSLFFDTIVVFSGFPGGGCGYLFEPGRCYLVFAAVEADGLLRTSIVSRTIPIERAGELLAYINAYLGPPDSSFQASRLWRE